MPAPLAAIESPRSLAPGTELAAEQPRNFHFAVTWVTLFSHLDPIESTHRRPRPAPPASAPLALIVAPPEIGGAARGGTGTGGNLGNGGSQNDSNRPANLRTGRGRAQKASMISPPSNVIEISVQPGAQPQIDAAQALRSSGHLEEALRALSNASEYDPYLYTVRGEIEFALGRFHDAALSYFAVVHTEPDNADAHYNLALCLQRSDRWDASCQAFERVLSLDPTRGAARLGLGASLLYLNRLNEALASFYQCSETLPGPAMFGKAVALQLLHRFGEAENAYEELLAADPNSEETLSNLIALAIETSDLDRVRDYSQRLLKLSPQSPAALQGLATVALQHQDHHAAARYCDRIVQLAPDCLEGWHNLRVALDRILAAFNAPKPAIARQGVK